MSSPFNPQQPEGQRPQDQPAGPQSGGFPAAGQGFPAAGQGFPAAGQGFPAAGQGQGFPAAGQGQGFPQSGQGFPGGQQQGFGPAGPGMPAAGQGFPQSGPGFPQAPGGQPYPMAPGTPIGMGPGRPRRRLAVWLRLGTVAVVIIVGVIVWAVNQKSEPNTAAVGDCLGSLPAENSIVSVSADQAKKVDCNSSDAQAKVVGVLTGKSESDFNNTDVSVLCQSFPDTTTALYQADDSDSSTGTILCLKSLK